MDAFDKLVEKHFPQLGPLQMLMEMVEEQLDGFVPKQLLEEQNFLTHISNIILFLSLLVLLV